jgi:hypothetical protein
MSVVWQFRPSRHKLVCDPAGSWAMKSAFTVDTLLDSRERWLKSIYAPPDII